MAKSSQTASKFTPEQMKMKHNFASAKSVSEMLEAFTAMEVWFVEADLCQSYCTLVEKLHHEYNDSEKTLIYGKKALEMLLRNDSGMLTANVLHALGFSCFKVNRFSESYKYFSWAVRLLEKLEGTSSEHNHSILRNLHTLHLALFYVKHSMGTNEGCISYLVKNLRITEKIAGVHSKALADANKEICDNYLEQVNQKAALPFCLRALEIYLACPGDNTSEVAECSKILGILYTVLGDPEKALQHNQFSQKLSKNLGSTSGLLSTEIDAALILTQLGRFEEAVQDLMSIVARAEIDGDDQISALTQLGRTLCKQGKIEEGKNYLEIVCGILDKKMHKTVEVAVEFAHIAEVYERMDDFETSISILQKAIMIIQEEENVSPSKKDPVLRKMSGRLFELLVSAGKTEETIPYLEAEVEYATKNFGFWHVKVGHAYSVLGPVYAHTNKLQLGAESLAYAKNIFEKTLGSHDENTITMVESLWLAYKTMGSSSVAISFLKDTINCLELSGENSQDKATILKAELKNITMCEKVIPYFEADVETAIKNFGSKHVKVGEAYSMLGDAYFHTVNLQLAAEHLAYAKDILGSHHNDSIKIGETLRLTYKSMGSSSVAISFLEEKIKSLELLGTDSKDKATILKAELEKLTCDETESSNGSGSATSPDTRNRGIGFNVIRYERGPQVQETKSIYEKS